MGPEPAKVGAAAALGLRPAALEISGLHKVFSGEPVLRGIDLTVAVGEVVFIIGPSGSGKSTLLRCINRLEDPTSGTIQFAGELITADRRRINQVRQQIGFVFQSFNLYPHLTALGNVTLALRWARGMGRNMAEERGLIALGDVGLLDKRASYPGQLSGGQQQRVAIARALVLEPKIMLFDEPTSALDPELVGEVCNVILRLRDQGMTMVIVSHEMNFARQIADQVVFMDLGRIVEQAPPFELFTRPGHSRTRSFLQRHLNETS